MGPVVRGVCGRHVGARWTSAVTLKIVGLREGKRASGKGVEEVELRSVN